MMSERTAARYAVCGCVLALCCGRVRAQYVRPEGKPLAELARARGKHFGANFSMPYWGWGWQKKPAEERKSIYALGGQRAGYDQLARDHFTILVGGCDTFFLQSAAANGVYDFDSANALVGWLEKNSIAFHYHGLGYMQRNGLNQWAEGKSPEDVRRRYEDYIRKIVTNFRGKVLIYDFINEHAGYGSAFRGTPAYNRFRYLEPYHRADEGEVYAIDYYLTTLRIAHEIDPEAQFVYLDFNNEIVGAKSNVMYRTARALLERKAPLHAIGFQLHLSTNFSRSVVRDLALMNSKKGKPTVKHNLSDEAFIDSMRENCQRFADLGLDIWATEVSVTPAWEHVADEKLSLERQALVYRRLVEVLLEFPRYKGLKLWGIGGVEGLMQKNEGGIGAYLFDRKLRPKPCFHAVQEAFANYHPKTVAAWGFDGDKPSGFQGAPELSGAAVTDTAAFEGRGSLLFARAGDQLELRLDLSEAYNTHLSYHWQLKGLPQDRPFAEKLADKEYDREILTIEVSDDGKTWRTIRTYSKSELVYRLVETSPWHAGFTTLVGMDGKRDARIRFRALTGMDGREFAIDHLKVIADSTKD